MSDQYINLSWSQVAWASALVAINAFISVLIHLGLERRLVLAAVRMVIQLVLIGAVLRWVFSLGQWYTVVPHDRDVHYWQFRRRAANKPALPWRLAEQHRVSLCQFLADDLGGRTAYSARASMVFTSICNTVRGHDSGQYSQRYFIDFGSLR